MADPYTPDEFLPNGVFGPKIRTTPGGQTQAALPPFYLFWYDFPPPFHPDVQVGNPNAKNFPSTNIYDPENPSPFAIQVGAAAIALNPRKHLITSIALNQIESALPQSVNYVIVNGQQAYQVLFENAQQAAAEIKRLAELGYYAVFAPGTNGLGIFVFPQWLADP